MGFNVVVQVEYYPPSASAEVDNDRQCPSPEVHDQPDEEAVLNILWPGHKEQHDQKRVSEILAEYGYYARSMKPQNGWVNQCRVVFLLFSLMLIPIYQILRIRSTSSLIYQKQVARGFSQPYRSFHVSLLTLNIMSGAYTRMDGA